MWGIPSWSPAELCLKGFREFVLFVWQSRQSEGAYLTKRWQARLSRLIITWIGCTIAVACNCSLQATICFRYTKTFFHSCNFGLLPNRVKNYFMTKHMVQFINIKLMRNAIFAVDWNTSDYASMYDHLPNIRNIFANCPNSLVPLNSVSPCIIS